MPSAFVALEGRAVRAVVGDEHKMLDEDNGNQRVTTDGAPHCAGGFFFVVVDVVLGLFLARAFNRLRCRCRGGLGAVVIGVATRRPFGNF